MADMQARLGPMRVGPHGLLQPIADAVKLLLKEDIIPESADKLVFWGAPLISVTAAMLALAALPIGPFFQIADLNIGLLYILGVSSLGIFGIVLGGWASNSHYSLLGALRSAAQLVSYETSAGMAVVGGLPLAGTLSTRGIVEAQSDTGCGLLFSPHHQAARAGTENVHGCGGRALHRPGSRIHGTGAGAGRLASGGFEGGNPRSFLVPLQGSRLHLCIHVAAVHVSAIPLRSTHAAG